MAAHRRKANNPDPAAVPPGPAVTVAGLTLALGLVLLAGAVLDYPTFGQSLNHHLFQPIVLKHAAAGLSATGTATVTVTPTSTATVTLTPTSTATVTLTPTSTATVTLTPTSTATVTLTPLRAGPASGRLRFRWPAGTGGE